MHILRSESRSSIATVYSCSDDECLEGHVRFRVVQIQKHEAQQIDWLDPRAGNLVFGPVAADKQKALSRKRRPISVSNEFVIVKWTICILFAAAKTQAAAQRAGQTGLWGCGRQGIRSSSRSSFVCGWWYSRLTELDSIRLEVFVMVVQ